MEQEQLARPDVGGFHWSGESLVELPLVEARSSSHQHQQRVAGGVQEAGGDVPLADAGQAHVGWTVGEARPLPQSPLHV